MRAIWALGITELIAWGTTFYVLGVLGRPISADTGWSQSFVFGGMTAGLVASGLISTWIGRIVDRHGGRIVMTIGLVLAAAGHLVIAAAWTEWVYIAGWLLLGPAMRMVLYDAAFAAIVQVLPSRGRRAISYLTLFGGLASTVFWPVGHWLDGVVGWRATLVVFAALCLLVAAPLTWWGLARREVPDAGAAEAGDGRMMDAALAGHPDRAHPPLEGGARLAAVVLFGLVLAANAFVFGALSVHLVSVLQGSGLALGVAVGLASLKGVAQVAGRAWELYFGQGYVGIGARTARHRSAAGVTGGADLHRCELRDGVDFHTAARRLERARHHRPRRGAAGAVRRRGLWRDARHSRGAATADECAGAVRVRGHRRGVRAAGRVVGSAGRRGAVVGRDGTDGTLGGARPPSKCVIGAASLGQPRLQSLSEPPWPAGNMRQPTKRKQAVGRAQPIQS